METLKSRAVLSHLMQIWHTWQGLSPPPRHWMVMHIQDNFPGLVACGYLEQAAN